MNKKILVIPVLLLTFALLSLPVMAKPATKIEVTLRSQVTQTVTSRRTVDHNIFQSIGTSTGAVTLTILGQDLEGDWEGEWISRLKWGLYPADDPDAELLVMGKLVWTFTGEGTTGTFEGVTHRRITGWTYGPPEGPTLDSYFVDHMLLQGTGDFKGQTLKISFEGTLLDMILEGSKGYLIIPK